MRRLNHGVEKVLGGENYLVWSSPIAFTGDMMQQNANAGNLAPRADRGCRACRVTRAEIRESVERPHWLTTSDGDTRIRYEREIEVLRATLAPNDLRKEGLSPQPSPWQTWIPLSTMTQLPWDFHHLEIKGMCERYHQLFFSLLTDRGDESTWKIDAITLTSINRQATHNRRPPCLVSTSSGLGQATEPNHTLQLVPDHRTRRVTRRQHATYRAETLTSTQDSLLSCCRS